MVDIIVGTPVIGYAGIVNETAIEPRIIHAKTKRRVVFEIPVFAIITKKEELRECKRNVNTELRIGKCSLTAEEVGQGVIEIPARQVDAQMLAPFEEIPVGIAE